MKQKPRKDEENKQQNSIFKMLSFLFQMILLDLNLKTGFSLIISVCIGCIGQSGNNVSSNKRSLGLCI
jgi:hypothetical protein